MINSKLLGQPITAALIQIQEAFQSEIITPGGLRLWLDSSYNKNFTATVVGRITALPITAKNKQDEDILRRLKIGDEVVFSYQVVADLDYVSDGYQFMPTTEGDDRYREFISGAGEKLRVYALPNPKTWSDVWIGYYLNKYNQHVDGVQGDQETVERWLAQFPIGKTDRYTHRNLFSFNGKDYWKCDLSLILAKMKDGKPIAVNNRVICEPVEEKVPVEIKIQFAQLADDVKVRYQDRAKIISGSHLIGGTKEGDIIGFLPQIVEKYDIQGREYYLVNKNYVHSKY